MNLLLSFILGFPYQEEILDLPPSIEDGTSAKDQEAIKRNTMRKPYEGKTDNVSKNENCFDKNFIKPMPHLKKNCKIQYSLPSKEDKKKEIKVEYLGTCAEVTFKNVSTMVKCKIIEDKAFVPFSVLHQVDSKELNAPVQIKSHDIQIDFRVGKENTKENKNINKSYYYVTENINTDFGYLVESKNGEIPEKEGRLSLKAGKNDYLFIRPCKFHWKNMSILMERALVEIEARTKVIETKCGNVYISISPDDLMTKKSVTSKGSKSEKTTRSHKSEKSKPPDIKVTVSGNYVVYEKSVWTFEEFNSNLDEELLSAGLMLTNTGVYTSEQRRHFKSLSIFIKSIQNLPLSIKEKHKVNKIFLEYSFPPVCRSEVVKPIILRDLSKIKIKDVRTFFNETVSDDKLVESVQNNLLVVKILGRREKVKENIVPRVWGQELSCTDFAKRFNQFIEISEPEKENKEYVKKSNKKPESRKSKTLSKKSNRPQSFVELLEEPNEESVVLGYASISLYDLMKYSFRMNVSAQIHSKFLPTSNQFNIPLRPMNVMHFHKDYRPQQRGIVEATEYIDYKTVLKIEAKLGYDLARNVLPLVLTFPTLFTVCIIIDYDTKSSYSLLKEILDHNKTTLLNGRGMPNNLYHNLGLSPEIHPGKKSFRKKGNGVLDPKDFTSNREVLKDQNYITGFMVDSIDFSILMIESLEIQAVPKILVHRYQMLTEEGRMLYNSNLVFTERLYDEFVKFGGIFVSALGLPLDAVLNHNRVQEYVPAPALRCLETLRAITTSKKIQRNLFPTPLELLSMDVEFGVPLHRVETFIK